MGVPTVPQDKVLFLDRSQGCLSPEIIGVSSTHVKSMIGDRRYGTRFTLGYEEPLSCSSCPSVKRVLVFRE